MSNNLIRLAEKVSNSGKKSSSGLERLSSMDSLIIDLSISWFPCITLECVADNYMKCILDGAFSF